MATLIAQRCILCKAEIHDVQPYHERQTEHGRDVYVCDDCQEIGKVTHHTPINDGLTITNDLRTLAPTRGQDGEWWGAYEIAAQHYWLDRTEISRAQFDILWAEYVERLAAAKRENAND